MDREELKAALKAWAPLIGSGYEVPAAEPVMHAAADLIDQQAARIAELEAERDAWDAMHTRQAEQTARYKAAAEKAEAERDAAIDQTVALESKIKTLCTSPAGTCACSYDHIDDVCALHSPQLTRALAERDAAWCAGRDAAANEIDCGCAYREQAIASTKHSRYSVCQQGECLARLAADIRALTPPETQP